MGRVAASSTFNLPSAAERTSGLLLSLLSACLSLAGSGCLNLRPVPLQIPPQDVPVQTTTADIIPPENAGLSGALDGPTLRLALRDLAVILDTLGRLEELRPDLKPQMLRELADADAATAAEVVRQWRARLPELQAAERDRTASAQAPIAQHSAAHVTPPAAPEPPAPNSPTQQADGSHRSSLELAGTTEAASASESPVAPDELAVSLVVDSIGDDDPPQLPSWDDLLESLVGMTRDRAEESGPDAARARIQLALLELVRWNHLAGPDAIPDSQLWHHLDPAIQYCLGSGRTGQASAQEVVRSLQVATELLRGPGRFQVRGLAFCNRIRGFGNIERAESNAFALGQAVLLYGEVEQFFSEPGPGGFRTRISSVVELLDATGSVVWSQDFGTVEDTSNGPRRDYFLSYRFRLPQDVKSGVYAVRLTLCDELANRSASGAIALSIR